MHSSHSDKQKPLAQQVMRWFGARNRQDSWSPTEDAEPVTTELAESEARTAALVPEVLVPSRQLIC